MIKKYCLLFAMILSCSTACTEGSINNLLFKDATTSEANKEKQKKTQETANIVTAKSSNNELKAVKVAESTKTETSESTTTTSDAAASPDPLEGIVLTGELRNAIPTSEDVNEVEESSPSMRQALIKLLESKKILNKIRNKNSTSVGKEVSAFYKQRNYRLGWQNATKKRPSSHLKSYISALQYAKNHGLKSKNYLLPEIKQLNKELYTSGKPSESKMAELDVLLTTSFIAYNNDLLSGQMYPRKRIWEIKPRSKAMDKALAHALKTGKIVETILASAPQHSAYKRLKQKMSSYQKVAEKGGWETLNSLNLSWDSPTEDGGKLAKRLAQMGDLPSKYANMGSVKMNNTITKAIKRYQKRHGLGADGSIGSGTLRTLNVPIEERIKQMSLAMERYRWLPASLGNRHVWVNIPEFKSYVIERGDTVANLVSVVGEINHATPVLVNKPLTNVVLSPEWNVPQSIAKEELEYIKMNPAVLITADVDVFYNGKKVDPRDINWDTVNWGKLRLRQKPKKQNSMGGAKFLFTNSHSVYLHDTPSKNSFEQSNRAASHGCVRVKNPDILAQKLLSGKKGWNLTRIRKAMNSMKQQYIKPPVSTKVHLYYMTTWVDGKGNLQFRNDVYGRDKRQFKGLL